MSRAWLIVFVLSCSPSGDEKLAPEGFGADSLSDMVLVESTNGELERSFALDLSGAGSNRVGSIELDDNVGLVEIHGRTLPVVAYRNTPPQEGHEVFQALAVGSNAWFVMWFFCKDGRLKNVFLEGSDKTYLRNEDARGSCKVNAGPVMISVELPQHIVRWPAVGDGERFSVKGKGISITDGAGELSVDGRELDVAVVSVVDCLDQCGLGGAAGWWELHSLLRDRGTGETCFAIAYLSPTTPRRVSFLYSLCLPSLTEPTPLFDASWTVPDSRRKP